MLQNVDFFADPLHRDLRTMLLIINKQIFANTKIEKQVIAKTLHRPIYMLASEIGLAVGTMSQFSSFDGSYNVALAQEKIAELGAFGLGWSIVRFGLDIEDPELVRAIARRVRIGQGRAASDPVFNTELIDIALDKLVEQAGGGLFSFDAFFSLAHQLELEGLGWLVKFVEGTQ